MNDLGNIEFEQANINLNTTSLKKLQELLEKVNERKKIVNQELDKMLKSLE